MFIGTNGLPDPATSATFVADAANPVDLKIGPGGEVFYVDHYGGTIRRIRYASSNQAPNAVIQATPLSGPLPLSVIFDGRASSDPNAGDTLTYSWDLNGDGFFGDALTAQTSYTYTQAKLYNVQLKVMDNQGAFDVVRVVISAGNSQPTAFIDTSTASTQWQVGQSMTFSGHATDPDQGTLPASALSWEMILHHCSSNSHTHPIESSTGVTTASFTVPDHGYYSYLEIKLTVTDAGGLTDTKSVFLDPQTVTLNFASTPSGLQQVVGSSSDPTPFTKTVILGSANSVSAVTPQTLGSIPYYFASWSDGGNQSHLITGTAAATYMATYSLTAADTTPPTVPSSLTTGMVSGTQITLSWPAWTDNVGVTGYQVERCQGVGCTTFAFLATATTTSYLDTGLTYSYRIRARDAAGNLSGNSSIATATTDGGVPASGLVAAYGFNEGTGAISSDASGNSNTATLNTATWRTQGKFGNALSFNGTSKVTVPDAPSLDLTTGMTLEAWVYPTVAGGGEWPTIMMKEAPPGLPYTFAYVLYGKVWSPTGPVRPGMRTFTTAGQAVSGGSVLPANTWSHFAGTYDGTTLRVYINGTQVASLAATGALVNSSGLLSIGGNLVSSIEYFTGRLDEIRLYNRALSVSEIQQDMTTPVDGL